MNTISTSTAVLIRRRMFPDEWPETYLASLVRSHGIRRPWAYDVDRIRGVLPWERVEERGIEPKGNAAGGYLQGRPQYGPMPLPAWASVVRATCLRYCPMCLIEARYIRTRWRISGLVVCTLHGCLLKSDLVEPALTANYTRRGPFTVANCEDAHLLEGAACCMPQEFQAVSMVWSPFEAMAMRSLNPREDALLGAVASWSVLEWRMLEEISRIHHKKVIKQPTTGSLTGIGRLLHDLAVSVAPSREGALALIEALRENAHVLAARRFLDVVRRQEAESPTALSALPLSDLSARLAAAAPQASSRTRYGEISFRDMHERAMCEFSVNDDLAPLGAGKDVIARWIRMKVIRTIESLDRGGKTFRFIEREEMRQARKFLQSLIHARDLVAAHELDWPTYVALRDTGLIGPGVPGMRGYFQRRAIGLLMDKLELMSTPGDGQSCLRWRMFCEDMLFAAEQRATFAAFIHAATCGRFAVYRDLVRPGLAAFSVGVDGIAWLAGRRRSFFWTRRGKRGQAQPDLFEMQEERVPG